MSHPEQGFDTGGGGGWKTNDRSCIDLYLMCKTFKYLKAVNLVINKISAKMALYHSICRSSSLNSYPSHAYLPPYFK